MRSGAIDRQTHDDFRHGTTTRFAALNVATGKVLGKCYKRYRQDEFVDFLKTVETNVAADQDIQLILDNEKMACKKASLASPRYSNP